MVVVASGWDLGSGKCDTFFDLRQLKVTFWILEFFWIREKQLNRRRRRRVGPGSSHEAK